MNEDEPRLYSKPRAGRDRLAVDEVKPEHFIVHDLLERWGQWNREPSQVGKGTCNSIEKRYYRGGRDALPASTAPMAADPQLVAIDAVVRRMHYGHQTCIRMFYAKRCKPNTICHAVDIRYEDFAQWMYDARQMVVNLLGSA